jgi:hypothetical protein
MSTTAWTQTDLDELEKAIASGALSVKYSDKQVNYRSLSEMLQIRNLIKDALGKNSSCSGNRITMITSKGL